MKTTFFFLLMTAAACAGTFVQTTDNEFSAAGDFDGDGSADVLVVDRVTGVYRIGYGGGGALVFSEARPSGMPDISSVAVGRLAGTSADSLVVASPAQNRALLLRPLTTGHTEPAGIHTAGHGPSLLAALDLPSGAGATPEDDLAVLALYDPARGHELRQLRAGPWSLLRVDDVPDVARRHANPLTPAPGAQALLAFMQEDAPGAHSFRAWTVTGVAAGEEVAITGLPPGVRFVCEIFEGTTADVMLWTPGMNEVGARRIVPDGAGWAAGAGGVFGWGKPVAQIAPVRDSTGMRLLVRFEDGTLAVHGYTLAGGFGPAEFIVPVGAPGVVSGIVPLPGAGFHLLHAPGHGQPSTHLSSFTHGAGGWAQTGVTALSPASTTAAFANVLALDRMLLREDFPLLKYAARVPDFSTGFTSGSPGSAMAARFLGAESGLGAPAAQSLPAAPAAPAGTAVNQLHGRFSLFSFENSLGVLEESVLISPPPGTYDKSVRVTFSGMSGGAQVYFRLGEGGSFTLWNPSNPPWITRPATVEYYAQGAAGRSVARKAAYAFSRPPALLDADGDGIPDFVEADLGMDPEGGADTDGDGFSDLEELLAGTDWDDAADFPSSRNPAADALMVDVSAQLRDTAGVLAARAADQAVMTVSDPFGNPLASGEIGAGGAAAGFARCRTAGVDTTLGFLIVSTGRHFTTEPAVVNDPAGRQFLGVIPALEPEAWTWAASAANAGTVNLVDKGNDPAPFIWNWGGVNWRPGSENWDSGLGEASRLTGAWSQLQLDERWGESASGDWSSAAWLAAYTDAARPAGRPYARITLDAVTSLEALMMREAAGILLSARVPEGGAEPGSPRDFLDASFTEALRGLRRVSVDFPDAPVARLNAALKHIHQRLHAAEAGAAKLRTLARDVYARHQALAGDALDTLTMPLDALAAFVQNGELPADHAAATSLSAADLAQALAHWDETLATLPQRVPQTWTDAAIVSAVKPGLSQMNVGGTSDFTVLDAGIRPYQLPTTAEVPAGAPFTLKAYADLPEIAGTTAVEVVALSLTALPFVVDEDSDGDLLPDSWELRHFGTLAFGTHDVRDGSGHTLAQQYFEGTHPLFAFSLPPVAPTLLEFSGFHILPDTPGLRLHVDWPARYSSVVDVTFRVSTDLSDWTSLPALPAFETTAGRFTRLLSLDHDRAFYLPRASLKR